MNRFGVSSAKLEALRAKMDRLQIREQDLLERFLRSRGPGGQNVNKVSTCVVLRHLVSGLEVRVQRERSQALNRFLARRLLADKLETLRLGALSQERQKRYKIRRQKRRRSRRAKEKMLRDKRHQSQKKQLRRQPSEEE